MQQSPREHHEPRRGSAFRAAPRLVHCRIAAISADPCTRAALPSSLRAERIATPCHSSPEQHDESGMANDEQMGRGVAGECWRAHQVRHCHRRGQRSRFGRRWRPQLDAVRQPCAALLTRPTYGTCPARAPSTPATYCIGGWNGGPTRPPDLAPQRLRLRNALSPEFRMRAIIRPKAIPARDASGPLRPSSSYTSCK